MQLNPGYCTCCQSPVNNCWEIGPICGDVFGKSQPIHVELNYSGGGCGPVTVCCGDYFFDLVYNGSQWAAQFTPPGAFCSQWIFAFPFAPGSCSIRVVGLSGRLNNVQLPLVVSSHNPLVATTVATVLIDPGGGFGPQPVNITITLTQPAPVVASSCKVCFFLGGCCTGNVGDGWTVTVIGGSGVVASGALAVGQNEIILDIGTPGTYTVVGHVPGCVDYNQPLNLQCGNSYHLRTTLPAAFTLTDDNATINLTWDGAWSWIGCYELTLPDVGTNLLEQGAAGCDAPHFPNPFGPGTVTIQYRFSCCGPIGCPFPNVWQLQRSFGFCFSVGTAPSLQFPFGALHPYYCHTETNNLPLPCTYHWVGVLADTAQTANNTFPLTIVVPVVVSAIGTDGTQLFSPVAGAAVINMA